MEVRGTTAVEIEGDLDSKVAKRLFGKGASEVAEGDGVALGEGKVMVAVPEKEGADTGFVVREPRDGASSFDEKGTGLENF